MRRTGLVVLGVVMVFFLFNFASAADEVGAPSQKIDGAGGAGGGWQKPNKIIAQTEVLPPGIAKREGDIPGKGKHLGWQIGKHKGWDKAQAENIELKEDKDKPQVSPTNNIVDEKKKQDGKPTRTGWNLGREGKGENKHAEINTEEDEIIGSK